MLEVIAEWALNGSRVMMTLAVWTFPLVLVGTLILAIGLDRKRSPIICGESGTTRLQQLSQRFLTLLDSRR